VTAPLKVGRVPRPAAEPPGSAFAGPGGPARTRGSAAQVACLLVCFAALASAQQFQFNLDRLAAKASDTVEVSLDGSTLQFAAKFLDSKDPDQDKVKKLIAGLSGVYVRSFEFEKTGEWTAADLEGIRTQLKTPEWSKIVSVKSNEGETDEIYLRNENGKLTGVAVIAAEPKELTVVNIVGPIDLESLAELGGHFGIPKLDTPKKDTGKQK
jgi:hypothetical protein